MCFEIAGRVLNCLHKWEKIMEKWLHFISFCDILGCTKKYRKGRIVIMKKKIVIAFMTALCVGAMLSGCGKNEEVTVTDEIAAEAGVFGEEAGETEASVESETEVSDAAVDEIHLDGAWDVSGVYLDGEYLDSAALSDYGITVEDLDAHLTFSGNGGSFVSGDMSESESFTYFVQFDDFGTYVMLEYADGSTEALEYNDDGRLVIAYGTEMMEGFDVDSGSSMGVAFERSGDADVEPSDEVSDEAVETEAAETEVSETEASVSDGAADDLQ